MNTLALTAHRHPLAFGLSVTFFVVVMLVASAVLAALLPGEGYASLGGLLGRLVSSALLMALLKRLGWLRPAGLVTLGGWQAWLLLWPSLAYAWGAAAYAVTGQLAPDQAPAALPPAVLAFIAAAALLEGLAFRGLVQYALIGAWGSTYLGRVMSIGVAALYFGGLHLVDALSGRPLLNVLLQSGQAAVLGVWLGALVLSSRSLYPAVVFHMLFNLAGYQLFGRQGLEPAPSAWLHLGALLLPLLALGLGLLGRAPARFPDLPVVAGAAGLPPS